MSVSREAEASTTHPGSSTAHIESFDIDDSEQQGLLSGRSTGRQFNRVVCDACRRGKIDVLTVSQPPNSNSIITFIVRPLRLLIAIIAVPYTLLRAILRTLHIPLPLPPVPLAFSITGLGLTLGGSRPGLGSAPTRDPKVAAERWIQSLEEETGCVSFSRSQAGEGEASGVASGSSTVHSRRQGDESSARFLPDFFIGSYESFAKTCATEVNPKIGCVVIVSEEHDDVAAFKRYALSSLRVNIWLMASTAQH